MMVYLMNCSNDIAYNLIEDMEKNHHLWGNAREITAKEAPQKGGLYEVSHFDHMNDKIYALSQKIENLRITHISSTACVSLSFKVYGVNGYSGADSK